MRISTADRLYDYLVSLKGHLSACQKCKTARLDNAPRNMCSGGLMMTLRAAEWYDSVAKLKRKAHADPAGHVYACPDLRKHGRAYALTVEPLRVTGIQEKLF